MAQHTRKNLRDVEDAAAKHGFSDTQEARFPREELDAETVGLAYLVLRPNKRQPFAHQHNEAEEVYVVLSGSGKMKLDEDVIEVDTMDAIRVAPKVTRAFEAGPDGMELLVFGTHHEGDAEMVQDFWATA